MASRVSIDMFVVLDPVASRINKKYLLRDIPWPTAHWFVDSASIPWIHTLPCRSVIFPGILFTGLWAGLSEWIHTLPPAPHDIPWPLALLCNSRVSIPWIHTLSSRPSNSPEPVAHSPLHPMNSYLSIWSLRYSWAVSPWSVSRAISPWIHTLPFSPCDIRWLPTH